MLGRVLRAARRTPRRLVSATRQLTSREQTRRQVVRAKLLELMPDGSVGAEIGVWRGDFSNEIIRHVRPRKLHLIDPWRVAEDPAYARSLYGSRSGRGQARLESAYRSVIGRFAPEITEGVVEVHRKPSAIAAADFEDDYFDWVYVDGDHTYEGCRQDLELFAPRIRPGGYLAGDDYKLGAWWGDGVIRAVDEFRDTSGWELVLLEAAQFVFRRPAEGAATARPATGSA